MKSDGPFSERSCPEKAPVKLKNAKRMKTIIKIRKSLCLTILSLESNQIPTTEITITKIIAPISIITKHKTSIKIFRTPPPRFELGSPPSSNERLH